ncbi:IGF2 [Mytilus coruscus]|uniref:IGF2 n=1 Tax=Mytilus coruscus TaxID=42192 RepID=A0A6J8DSW9_MYTCO|nr:IGF2 [Mytilus coruscus]
MLNIINNKRSYVKHDDFNIVNKKISYGKCDDFNIVNKKISYEKRDDLNIVKQEKIVFQKFQLFSIIVVLLSLLTTTSAQDVYLCGGQLTSALESICRGEYHDVRYTERSARPSYLYDNLVVRSQQNSGIIDECCYAICSFETLQSYCLHPQTTEKIIEIVTDEPERETTTATTLATTLRLTSTTRESVKSRKKGRNGFKKLFYFRGLGQNPTRLPSQTN